MLYEALYEDCTLLVGESVPDNEGGTSVTWTDGDTFKASIMMVGTSNGETGSKQASKREYKVTTPVGVGLRFHDVFRRESDGAIFRVTAKINSTPKCATFAFEKVSCEEWRLP